MNPLKWLQIHLLKRDMNPAAGVSIGPINLRLPASESWMERSAGLHDYDYLHSDSGDKSESAADFDLFYRWTLEAHSQVLAGNSIEACRRANAICFYWPLARRVGQLIYWRPKE